MRGAEYDYDMNDSLKHYVQKIHKLPTLPVVAQEILSIVNNDTTSVRRIEKVAENDPAISAKILSAANSAFFGLKVQTKTLDSAIMRIGFNNVKSIALAISLMTVLQDKNDRTTFDYKRIFNHSITVGFVARILSKRLKLEFAEEIMMNGMLHDLGYLVLNKYFPQDYGDVLEAHKDEGDLLGVESRILGFNHGDIGKWVAEQWNLPHNIIDTIMYHHNPSRAKKNLKRIAVIHIADYITTGKMLSPTEQDPQYPFDHVSLDILDITESELVDIEGELTGEYAAEMFS